MMNVGIPGMLMILIVALVAGGPLMALQPPSSPAGFVEPAASTSRNDNTVTIGADPQSPISLERQLSWGVVHSTEKISAESLRSANARNGPRVRETFSSSVGAIEATTYEKLGGKFAVRYVFAPQRISSIAFIALTTFEDLTKIDREVGGIDERERLFHLEVYGRDGRAHLIAVYENEPPYDVVKRAVLTALNRGD